LYRLEISGIFTEKEGKYSTDYREISMYIGRLKTNLYKKEWNIYLCDILVLVFLFVFSPAENL
jgi:hypothetical protein